VTIVGWMRPVVGYCDNCGLDEASGGLERHFRLLISIEGAGERMGGWQRPVGG
jgi:hypothetical protein